MDVLEPEELPQGPNDNKKVDRDSYLSPTFFRHAQNCSSERQLAINRHLTDCYKRNRLGERRKTTLVNSRLDVAISNAFEVDHRRGDVAVPHPLL